MEANIFYETATLYVDGIARGAHSQFFKAETQSVFLLASYCRNTQLNLVIVTKKTDASPKHGIQPPEGCFLKMTCIEDSEMCQPLQACALPAIVTDDKFNVFSGLCTVLRYIVKRASHIASSTTDKMEEKTLLELLGHRLYCLKSCAEVSPRTQLCECHMPVFINSDQSIWISHHTVELPLGIKLFEKLLNEPVTIHNMDKKQRMLLQRLEASNVCGDKGSRKRKLVTWTKDLPALEHVFAEGVNFSLTDICLFPSIHHFIEEASNHMDLLIKLIPVSLTWYKRLSHITRFSSAVSQCRVVFLELSDKILVSNTLDSTVENETEVLQLNSGCHNEDVSYTSNAVLTMRRDLPSVLEKINSKGVHAKFDSFCHENISLPWEDLPKQLHPVEGELGSLRALRKCSQIENIAAAVKDIAKCGDTIVDFCSGGGHVGIVLAHILPNCHIILVENKEESLQRARSRIYSLSLKNISVYQCNLEYFVGNFQIGVALHACGVASDMVIQRCFLKKASFVVSPCCYGKVRNRDRISYPQSQLYKDIPLSFDESLLLGHAADKTSWNFEDKHAIEGKKCMGLVDVDRAFAARERGYEVTLYTMQPPTCSPKNNLLVGVASRGLLM